MYIVVNNDYEIVAHHEEYDVCRRYRDNVYKTSQEMLEIINTKKKKISVPDDLYLERFLDTYVPKRYILYLELSGSIELYEDHLHAKDTIFRILEHEKLGKKQKKGLIKGLEVLLELLDDEMNYTPSPDECKRLEEHYSEFLHYNYDE